MLNYHRPSILAALGNAQKELEGANDILAEDELSELKTVLAQASTVKKIKTSSIVPRFKKAFDALDGFIAYATKPDPDDSDSARQLIVDNLPSFVYYSNYGNLDSEIYLPHVIENLTRKDLGNKENAKARTLKVLFDFVKLSPTEILELGRDHDTKKQGEPTPEQIELVARNKKEREILLQSASVNLTQKFRDWWKQGTYRFRFQADGDHFRIWVSDDVRTEEIELESRSTSLQWFFSFYLIFLVESAQAHKGAMLLLDEPGLSLHPLAQNDLSDFFANLSNTNQIIYTTHSPFMVDPDHLDRVRAVYVTLQGKTEASPNLKAAEENSPQFKSIYPVYAALGLSVSKTLFQGCVPVIVEGASDQHYLNAIKNYLTGKGIFNPSREILFVPATGARGVRAVASILSAKDENLPFVVFDSDAAGKAAAKSLKQDIYRGAEDRIIMVGEINGLDDAEVEDLFPTEFLAKAITRYLRRFGPDEDFSDVVVEKQPIIPQVESYARVNAITLETPGWKVDVARDAKTQLLKNDKHIRDATDTIQNWKTLFSKFDT